MDHFGEKPKFEVQPTIEQKPFESLAVQSFFIKWCEINDSILPQVVDRREWNDRQAQGILEKRPDGKQTLFIPEDLQLWEMIGVMEAVDKDTFAAKSEKGMQAKEKMLALGKTFENTGVYIARRLNGIENGREIAEALAVEFHQYGQALTQGEVGEVPQINELAKHDLTPQETEAIDRFLAGDSLYESRKQRVEKLITDNALEKDNLYEVERQKTLVQFFRVAEKAFTLEDKGAGGELRDSVMELKPWQNETPIHRAFLKRIERALTKQIEAPKREFETAVFRRGLEKLVGEMEGRGWKHNVNRFFDALGLNLRLEQERLVETLHISQLRADLEAARQTGDPASVAPKEREIGDKIHGAVSKFPYKRDANNPSEMVANHYINCVGASTLGGALMKEAGLNYLVGNVPDHSVLFLVTSDGQVEWRDMLETSFNEHLTDDMIKGSNKDGKPLTVADIVAFSKEPKPEGLMFDIHSPKYREKLRWVKEGQRQFVTVFDPEYGERLQILNNTGIALTSLGRYEEAIEAYRQAVGLDPKFSYPYNGMGNALTSLGRYEEAIEAYRQSIEIDPWSAYPYYGLGLALTSLGRYEEAIEAYRQSIKVDPTYVSPYHGMGNALTDLGRYEEAIEAYRQAVGINPKFAYSYYNLGNVLYSLGRDEEAIEAYRQSIKVDPKSAHPYYGLGNVLVDLDRPEEAIEAYKQFIHLADTSIEDSWIKQAEQIIAELRNKTAR